MSSTAFLPSLSSIVNLDALPENLQFIETGVDQLFNDIYFRELQYARSDKGDEAFYSLILVLNKKAGFTIPGTEMDLVLNPDFDGTSVTEIPITLAYQWKLLALIKQLSDFSIESFAFDGKAFFDLIADIIGLDAKGLLSATLNQFQEDADPLDMINSFVGDINTHYGSAIPNPTATEFDDAMLETLDIATTTLSKNPFEIIFEVYISAIDIDESIQNVQQLFAERLSSGSVKEYINDLLIPKVSASLELSAGLIFPRKYLTPLDASNNMEPFVDQTIHSAFLFDAGKLAYSTEGGIGFDEYLDLSLNYPSQIGNTGLIIALKEAKLDISREKNIPEANLDGRPNDFVGVYIEEASITLPEKWFKNQNNVTAKIFGRKLLIGTGGLSGKLGLEIVGAGPNPALTTSLGSASGFELGFTSFDLVFKQNSIIQSNLKGYIKIPGFKDALGNDAQLDIVIHIEDDGDFSITASEEQGIDLIRIPDILDVNLKSLTVGRESSKFYVEVSGSLDFADQSANSGFIGDNLPKDIEIQKLIIWEDGKIEFQGGGLELRKPVVLKLGPVNFSVTALHFGSHEQNDRKYVFFGFDGGLSLKPGGVDVRGEGIKFYFTVDDGPLHVFIRIQSISIDLIIPGDASAENAALLLNGYLSMKEPTTPGGGSEYAGGITFTLPKLKMGGSAAMRYNPDVPAFLIDVGFEIPTPIPLGPTGLGIYGLRGLVGSNYVATKKAAGLTEDAKWYEYYKAKIAPDYKQGIQASKFEGKPGFSIGAGVSLATSTDSGKVFSAKVFFLLSLPEVFLIEGQAAILKERIGLDSTIDPPFYAFISITSQSVETALGANFPIPDSGDNKGDIVKVDALIEIAFFFGNSLGWYVNFGRDLPEEKRIRARILTLFDAYFYLMLSSSGIKTGAGVSYKLDKKFGPLRARLVAYIDVWGELSFKPIQVGGGMRLGGELTLTLFGIGFSISAEAGISAEAPYPFVISGYVKACVKVLWTKKCAKFSFTWTFEETLNLDELRIIDVNPANSAQALHIKTGEAFPLIALETAILPNPSSWSSIDDFVIPVDSYIDFEFKKGIAPNDSPTLGLQQIGGTPQFTNTYYISPKKAKFERVKHQLFVDEVQVKIWNPSSNNWVDYSVYDAISAYGNASLFPSAPGDMVVGSWQIDHPNQCNKLRLLARTSLDYLRNQVGDNQPNATELFNITTKTIFCEGEKRKYTCIPLLDIAWEDLNKPYLPSNRWVSYENLLFLLEGQTGAYANSDKCDVEKGLVLNPGEKFTIRFPDHVSYTELCISTVAPLVIITYYKWIDTGNRDINNLPIYGYDLVEKKIVNANDATTGIIYDDNDAPIQKVRIEASECQKEPADETCEPIYTKEFYILQKFLNELAARKDLTTSFKLFPDKHEAYKNSFFGTALYPFVPSNNKFLKYIVKHDNTNLIAILDDGEKRKCKIILTTLKGEINFKAITGFTNLRVRPSATGNFREFLIDAIINPFKGVKRITLKGRSCYDLYHCKTKADIVVKTNISLLENLLSTVSKKGILSNARKLNIRTGKYANSFSRLLKKPSMSVFKNTKNLHYFTSNPDKESKQMSFTIAGDGGKEMKVEITSKIPLPFNEVSRFKNININEKLGVDEDVSYFKGEAVLNRKPYAIRIKLIEKNIRDREEIIAIPTRSKAEKKNAVVCSEISLEGKLLKMFLGALVAKRDFFKSNITLFRELYSGVFHDTPLYENDLDVYIKKTFDNKFRFEFELFDKKEFRCYLHIEIQSGKYSLYDVIAFKNIRPLTSSSPGIHYDFSITAVIFTRNGPIGIECIGKSCYPIIECEEDPIRGKCFTMVHKLCYLSQEDSEYNDSVTDLVTIQDDVDNMIEGLNTLVQPIWRPNSVFAVQVNTRDEVEQRSSPYTRSFVFGFKTGGGIGFYHNFLDKNGNWKNQPAYGALLGEDKEDTYKLSVLNHYVDYNNSFPNADGRLTNAKPLFFVNPQLRLFFNEQYVSLMYSNWGAYAGNEELNYELEAMIKDPVDSPTNPNSFIVGSDWERHDSWYVNSDVESLNSMMYPEGADAPLPCVTTTKIISIGINSAFIVPELKPLKAYSAIFNAKFKKLSDSKFESREVHRYIFQTSRYRDFEDQVMSFELKDDNGLIIGEALFNTELTTTPAMLTTAQSLLNDSMLPTDPLVLKHADQFDRLFSGIFKMTSLQAPVTTEFNVLKSGIRIIGILIRNPEPFNDPKLPENELSDTVSVSINGASRSANQLIYSKDNAAVFITNANHSLNMDIGTYNFEFKFKLYDGTTYKTESTISSVQLTIN
jgi:hypothetical protein